MWNFYELENLMEAEDWRGKAGTPAYLKPPQGQEPPAPVDPNAPVRQNVTPDAQERASGGTPGSRSTRQTVNKRQANINPGLERSQKDAARLGDELGKLNSMLTNEEGDRTGWLTKNYTVALALADNLGGEEFDTPDFYMYPYILRHGRTGGAPYRLIKGNRETHTEVGEDGREKSTEHQTEPSQVILSDPELIRTVIAGSWSYLKDPKTPPEDWEKNQRIRRGSKVFGNTEKVGNSLDLLKMDTSPEGKIADSIFKNLAQFVNDEGYAGKKGLEQLARTIGAKLKVDPGMAWKGFQKLYGVAPQILQQEEDPETGETVYHITTHVPQLGDQEADLAQNRGGRGATTKSSGQVDPTYGAPVAKKKGASPVKKLNSMAEDLHRRLQDFFRTNGDDAQVPPDSSIDGLRDQFLQYFDELSSKYGYERVAKAMPYHDQLDHLLQAYEKTSPSAMAYEWLEIYESMCMSGV